MYDAHPASQAYQSGALKDGGCAATASRRPGHQDDPQQQFFLQKAAGPSQYRPWAAGRLADCHRSESISSMGCGIIVDNSRAAPPGCARRATGRFRGHKGPRYPPTTTRKAHDDTFDQRS